MGQRSGCGTIAALLLLVSFVVGMVGSYRLDAQVDSRRERGGVMSLSMRVCEATHPVETWRAVRGVEQWKAGAIYNVPLQHICEKQHVIQQASALCAGELRERECDWRTVYWPRSLHQYTDSTGSRVFRADSTFDRGVTGDNHYDLEAAYKMGAYGIPWSVVFVDYRDKAGRTADDGGYSGGSFHLVALNMDGVSNLVYFWSWLVNLPQKYVNQAIYIYRYNAPSLWIDLALNLIWTLAIDLPVAIVCTIVGLIGGTILNPVDTLFAVPGGCYLFFESLWTGGAELLRAVPRIGQAI